DEYADAFARNCFVGQHRGYQRQEQSRSRIGEKKQQQRPEIEHELEDGIELSFFRVHAAPVAKLIERIMWLSLFHATPTIAFAKSFAENGARSSVPSPTPTKCTGRPYFAAMATRMPPRAVPSSLVM